MPNAALRFRPPADVASRRRIREGCIPRCRVVVTPPRQGGGRKRDSGSGTVHVLADGKPKAVLVGVGITDNRVTEITSGDPQAGDHVIIGENLSTDAPAAGNRPRMRMF